MRPHLTLGERAPALAAWRRRGDFTALDALRVAAAEEATALEAERLGQHEGAERGRATARAVVVAAAACEDLACAHAGSDCLRRRDVRRRQAAEERRLHPAPGGAA